MAVRLAGRISDWNDDKGYGFVTPHDGGTRAFVHVKAFASGSRRPVAGDLISYETTRDPKGRSNAINVRFAGQRVEGQPVRRDARSARSRRMPRRALGMLSLAAVVVAAALGWVPVVVPLAYGLLSVASYLVYWWDKDAAGVRARRMPEDTLHLLDVLGGWPGALIAQQQFRHKTVKASFQWMFWSTVLVNTAVTAALVYSGWAETLTRVLLGL
jgi:uncharacterized membrane protein YsdA (DUF1294 family)/cold shock CspA family protein